LQVSVLISIFVKNSFMKENEIDRRLDLSSKFMRMGQSLITEGRDNKDIAIAQIGTILIFMSGLLIGDDDDIFKFSDLCSMFSSQKILDSLNEKNPLAELFNNRIDDDTYDEFVKRINSLRNKKDDKNDDDVN
jgi:hypothetical protein